MAPLTGPALAAVEAFFASRRGDRSLRKDDQDLLVAFVAGLGMTVTELRTNRPVVPARHTAWLEEWADIGTDAGITGNFNSNNLKRWIDEEDTSVVAGVRAGKAYAVADALTKKGLVIDRAAELAIAAALVVADQGDKVAQCRVCDVVFLLYVGQLPGDEDRVLFEARRQAGGMDSTRSVPTVDMRRFVSYGKLHSGTTVPTLERALLEAAGTLWPRYYAKKIEQLNTHGYPLAAVMFIEVVAFARSLGGGWATERVYLHYYFFEAHLGCGLPEECCMKGALQAKFSILSADTPSALEMRPTVPTDMAMPAMMAQLQAMSMGALPQHQMVSQPPQLPGFMPQTSFSGDFGGQKFGSPITQQLPPMQGGMAGNPMAWHSQPQWMPMQQMQRQLQAPVIEDVTPGKGPCWFCKGAHDATQCHHAIKAKADIGKVAQEKTAKAIADRVAKREAAALAAAGAGAPIPP